MPRIKITKANEAHFVPVSNGVQHAHIPVDGKHHEIHEDLLPVLDDSAVEYELENADAPSGSAAAEGAAGLGGQAAPSPRRKPATKKAPKKAAKKAK